MYIGLRKNVGKSAWKTTRYEHRVRASGEFNAGNFAKFSGLAAYAIVGLVICKPCVILDPEVTGTFGNTRKKWREKLRGFAEYANKQNDTGVPKDYRRAAKVERAACAIGNVFYIAGFHLCMYSTDTLHPSPYDINYNETTFKERP